MRLPELWRLASMLRLFLTASRERRLVRGARLGMLCLTSSVLANFSSSGPGPCSDRRGARNRGPPSLLYSAWPWEPGEGERQRGEPRGEGE